MKPSLLIILAALAGASALPAAPVVEITDLMHVKVDGVPKGTVVDAIAAAPDARPAILDWLIEQQKKQVAATEAAKRKADADKADTVTRSEFLKSELAKLKAREEATGKGPRWQVLDELEGKANLTAKDIRKAEAQTRLDAARKELEEASK